MELFTNQVLAGIATGAIYACMALAVVMIYQAIDHLNFAQGEMAMFSTFISWQLMQWGIPYWWAFLATLIISFARRHRHRAAAVQAARQGPDPDQRRRLHRLLMGSSTRVAGLIWDFTIKQYPSPFGSSPFLGSQLISTHQAGMIGVTAGAADRTLFLFFSTPGSGLRCALPHALPESARWSASTRPG
jgi:branched-chain amino acid transport system permease protein